MNISEFAKPVKRKGALAALSEAQHQQLKEWVDSPQTYNETIKRVETDFGIPRVTISMLKNFRKKHCAPPARAVAYCPPFVPCNTWEFSLDAMVNALRGPETKIETRVRISAFFLQLVRMSLDQTKSKAKRRAPKAAKTEATKDNENAEKINPLDDQDKLDEVRRRVFGSAPE